MVYHSAQPCALKGNVEYVLPCIFIQMQRRWVTGAPFTDYVTSKLEGELEKCSIKQNLAFKMLLVNNVPDHPTTFQNLCEYTKVPLIPPNAML